MIKYNWNINQEERDRILNLHESATKNQYLIKEQEGGKPTGSKSWRLCQIDIIQSGETIFAKLQNGQTIKVPRLSEVSGVIQNKKLVLSELTNDGLSIGKIMKETQVCANTYPMQTQGNQNGNVYWFCYFDDVSRTLTGERGNEKFVSKNVPIYGLISWDGSLGTGGGDFLGEKIPKDKDGVDVKYGVSRSKSYILEVSPAMQGKPTVDRVTTTATTIPEVIQLNIEKPFEFDSTNLTPSAETEFKNFVSKVKEKYNGVKGDVEVICTSSVDGDPNELLPKKNNVSRKQYDLDLSIKRANVIADRLRKETGITTLNFIPKGIGQTTSYGPGWTKEKPTTPDQTAPNRRLMVKLPKLTITNK